MRQGFIKVAAVTPKIRVADPAYNTEEICRKLEEACGAGAKIIVFPELCITGYTCGELFLQELLLAPVLGIEDPKTDARIDFVGGIRGLKELERRVASDMTVAFSMYATSISELLSVADAGLLMPPKSTWFEPKLRSGLFIHRLS